MADRIPTFKLGARGIRTHNPKGVNRAARIRQARRALPTWSKQWRQIRAFILDRDPFCPCGRPATDVDHRDGDATNNDPENLQGLCRSCHSRKTAREDGGFGNAQRVAGRRGGAGQGG